jgi:hypothetical protein
MRTFVFRRATGVAAASMLLWLAAALPASAQYGRPTMSDPAVGEKYHVEASYGFWRPDLEATISSEQLGIVGTEIDVKSDLGYTDSAIRQFRLVLRPGKKHKFRVEYIPIKFESEEDTFLKRTIVFNGIEYNAGLPIQTQFEWDTWRLGYEYDFVYTDRVYAGFIIEVRQTKAQLQLDSPIDSEFTEARGPIPGIGGVIRVYPAKNFSITGEITGLNVPEIDEYEGQFIDIDIYGTFNFTNNFGVQGGYRALDASYLAKLDTGDLTLKGLYFTGVARF